MNKMLVAVFNSEVVAAEGLSALKGLHKDGDVTVYATAVLVKDASGKVSMKETADEGAHRHGARHDRKSWDERGCCIRTQIP